MIGISAKDFHHVLKTLLCVRDYDLLNVSDNKLKLTISFRGRYYHPGIQTDGVTSPYAQKQIQGLHDFQAIFTLNAAFHKAAFLTESLSSQMGQKLVWWKQSYLGYYSSLWPCKGHRVTVMNKMQFTYDFKISQRVDIKRRKKCLRIFLGWVWKIS